MKRYNYLIAFLLIFSLSAVAQESEWTFQEECAVYTTDDIPYNGTILATGYGGLHGINLNWETPHIVARANYSNGRLSPNQHWYAVLEEEVFYSESLNHEHFINTIHVYSTFDDNLVYSIPWENSWLQMWGYREIFWLDNSNLLYESSEEFVHDLDELTTINPFENTITNWNADIDILDGGSGFQREYIQFPSPDFTQTIYYRYDADRNLQYWALYDIDSGEKLVELNASHQAIFEWLPDASGFVGEMTADEEQRALVHLNSEGHELATIFNLGTSRIRLPNNIHSSNNGNLIAFKAQENKLFIADMDNYEVIDTCLIIADGFAWSPDDSQIAVLEPQGGTQNIYIFDLASWSYNAVARHIVMSDFNDRIVGWRND